MGSGVRRALFWGLAAVALSQAYILLGLAAGLLRVIPGPGALWERALLWFGGFLAVWAFVLTAVLWPFIQAKAFEKDGRSAWVLAALACLPLGGLAYYLGRFDGAPLVWDGVLAVVPAAFTLVIHYRKFGSALTASAMAAAVFLLSSLGFSDVLGPFVPAFYTASEGPGFYYLRTAFALAPIGCLLSAPPRVSAAGYARGLLVLSCLSLGVGWGQATIDWVALGSLATVFFFFRRGVFAEKARVWLSGLQLAALLLHLMRALWPMGATVLDQALWAHHLCMAYGFGAFLVDVLGAQSVHQPRKGRGLTEMVEVT